MKKGICVTVLALLAAGGVFAQIVVGVGGAYTGTEKDVPSTANTSSTWGFTIPVSVGYRMGDMGFGLDAAFGRNGQEPEGAASTAAKYTTTTVRAGGFFEYRFLQAGKFSFFGKAALGYEGKYDRAITTIRLGDQHQFYAILGPVLEYQLFEHFALFASLDFLTFTVTSYEYRQEWNNTTKKWDSIAPANEYKQTDTAFDFPIDGRVISDITIGFKLVF